jgi:flagellar assembly protein FliH
MGTETSSLFDTDFSDLEANALKEEKYSKEDIAAAKQEALKMARAELKGFEEKRAADLLAEMSVKLTALSAARAEDLQSATVSAVDIAVAMCRKMLPALAAQNALTEIESHISRTLAEVHGEPRVVVRVSEDNVAALQSGIEGLSSGLDGEIVLVADDRLPATDCHVMWADGGSERDVQRTWAEIDKAVEQITSNGINTMAPGPTTGTDPGTAVNTSGSSPDTNELEPFSEAID